mgnify:CR=1 FL=1
MEYNTSGIRTKRTSDDKTYRYIYAGDKLMRMTVGDDILRKLLYIICAGDARRVVVERLLRNNKLEGCFHIKVAALRWLLLFFKLTCMPLLLQYYVFTALHRIFAVLTIVSEYWQALLLLSLCNHIRTRNRLSII